MDIGYDRATSDAGASIIMVPSPTEVANTDRGNIQDAIDQAYENGGGTVILQKGKYVVNQASVDDYYAIEMKGGVKLIGCSSGNNWNSPDLGTIISVNNPDRSISVIWTSPDVMLYHGIVIKDIRFANGDVDDVPPNDRKMHVAISLLRTQMAVVENIWAGSFITGIQVTHWVNQIRNCKFKGCGIGIQLSGKPFVRNVTVNSVSGSGPWTLTLSSSYTDLYAGQYLWQGSSDKWRITSGVTPTGGNQITVESVEGSGTPATSSSDIYYIDYTDDANSGGPTSGSEECNACTIIGNQAFQNVHYGIYIKGKQNALYNMTIECQDASDTSTGIFVADNSAGNSIMNCYFEANSIHIGLDDGNVRGTKIIGNYVYYLDGENWIDYGNNTDNPEYGNSDFLTTRYNASTPAYEFCSNSIMGGNLGIGTTNPSRLLHVGRNSGSDIDGIIRFAHKSGANSREWDVGIGDSTLGGDDDNFFVRDVTGNDTLLVIEKSASGGKVGIGTTNPGQKLHIVGTGDLYEEIETDDSVGSDLGLFLKYGASYQAQFKSTNTVAGKQTYLGSFSGPLHIMSNNATRMTLDNDGKVGIGTTSPASKLAVSGGVSIGSNYVDDSAPSDGMIIEGNVGIGMTSPQALLHVDGSIANDYAGRFENTNTDGLGVKIKGGYNTNMSLEVLDKDDTLLFRSKGEESYIGTDLKISGDVEVYGSHDMTVDGNVGIGTDSPTAKVDIDPGTVSGSNPNIRLRGVTSSVPTGGEDGDLVIYEYQSSQRLYMKINGTWRFIPFSV